MVYGKEYFKNVKKTKKSAENALQGKKEVNLLLIHLLLSANNFNLL